MLAAICDLSYKGASEMLLVDEVDSKAFLIRLLLQSSDITKSEYEE